MSDISVGVISLDLIIKNKISEQLNGMKGSISKQIQNALDSSVTEATGKLKTSMEKTADTIGASAKKAVEKTMSQAESTVAKKSEEISLAAKRALEGFEVSSDPTQRLQQQLENTYEKISMLQKRWQELQTSLETTEDDAGAAKIIEQLNAVEGRIISLRDSAEKTAAKLNSDTDKLSQTIQVYEEKLRELKEQNAAKIEAIEQKSAARIEQINSKNAAMKEQFAIKAQAIEEQNAAKLEGIESTYQEKVEGLQIKNSDLREKLAKKNAGNIKKHLSSAFKGIGSISGKALDSLKGKFSNLRSSVNSMSKPVSKLGTMIKNAARRIFVMAGVLLLLKNIRSALSNAVKGNEEFAKSLNEVKTNLKVAFQPVIDAAMPAINELMSGLAAATRQLAEFTNQIFGTTYKKSLDTVNKIKDVGKEAKKNSNYLNSYDVMNVAQSNNKDDSSSSDSSSDQITEYGGDVKLTDWAQKMKDAIKSGDWSGVGTLLAEKVNGVFGAVNWENIRARLKTAVDGIADVLNGFVKNVNWTAAGKSIGEGVNTVFASVYELLDRIDFDNLGSSMAVGLNSAIETTDFALIGQTFAKKWNSLIDLIYGFVTKFDFSGFGKKLSEGVNGWFDEIDFKKAGTTLSEGVKGILDTVISFIENVNWKQIGEKPWTFISSIDWGGIVKRVAEAIGAAFGAAAALIWGFVKDAWSKVVNWWKDTAYKDGQFTISGLLSGIWDKIKGIGTWIKEKIFQPFINGFKKAFGIASPSKEMSTLGGYIIQGLYNGISAGIDKIKKICSKILSAIKDTFKNIGSWFKSKFTSAYKGITSVFSGIGKFFIGVNDKLKAPFVKIGSWFSEKFTGAFSSIKKIFSPLSVGSVFQKAKSTIVNVFKSIPQWFRSVFTTAWTNVKNVFSKGGKVFSGITSGIAETFKKIVNTLIDGINKVVAFPFKKINSMLNTIHDISILGVEPFSDLWDKDPLPVPKIPHLAKGGLAKAPTLALVGDNKNARTDPEVISPLSKLKDMIGVNANNDDMIAILRAILEAIKGGKKTDIYLGKSGVKLLTQEVVNEMNSIIASTGRSPINL